MKVHNDAFNVIGFQSLFFPPFFRITNRHFQLVKYVCEIMALALGEVRKQHHSIIKNEFDDSGVLLSNT